ncbi:enoyl-CoA hydratase/isomerase family protein [Frankia sp. CiP3]|uniref:enoyl-CoA hydratase/isomerase family protein n=1 Tax=Frankia sp. CiP3 TaxID=2880971 RepID=UPI001EF419DA|nr:enoyl-CoA hydratase-related protein [Frankia sp. CiP3]
METGSLETISFEEVAPRVAVLTLNRPDRLNAITLKMYDEIEQIVDALSRDVSTRVLVITGAGRGFCSGQDLRDLGADPAASDLGRIQFGMAWQTRAARLIKTIHELPQAVIAAVNGPASGAGLALALAADIRLAASSARFNVAFVRIGLSGADMGTSYFLPRIVGPTAAAEMMLTGRLIDALEARDNGLVLRVVDDGRVLDEALSIASAIMANSPFGVRMTKQVLWKNIDAPSLDAAMQLENRTQILASLTEDCREAEAAFLARRAPVFGDT